MRLANVALFFFVAITPPVYGRGHSLEIELLPSQNAIQEGVPTWKMGTPVTVLVRMINHTRKVIRFGLTNPAWNYEMDVRDGFGKSVHETDILKKLKDDLKNGPAFIFRNMTITLKPDQSADDTIEVSYFYKLDHPGQYSIQVRRTFPNISNKAVRSSRLTLTLSP